MGRSVRVRPGAVKRAGGERGSDIFFFSETDNYLGATALQGVCRGIKTKEVVGKPAHMGALSFFFLLLFYSYFLHCAWRSFISHIQVVGLLGVIGTPASLKPRFPTRRIHFQEVVFLVFLLLLLLDTVSIPSPLELK